MEKITKKTKEEAVVRLFEESALDFDFFFLLVISTAIIAMGLLLNSPTAVIGGMMIAPVLFPILSLSMGIVVSDIKLVRRSVINLLWSMVLVVLISMSIAFFVWEKSVTSELAARGSVNLAYFLIAVFSGAAAAYALVKTKISEALPGVAIAVALIPPLSTVGIATSMMQFELAVGALGMFFMNLLGIIFSAMIVFSGFSFFDVKRTIAASIKAEEVVNEKENKKTEIQKIDEIAKTVKKAAEMLEEKKNNL